MSNKSYFNIMALALACFCLVFQSCKKFLDAKPSQNLVVPNTLASLQALLDDYDIINRADPFAAEVSADNFFLLDGEFNNSLVNDYQRNIFTWRNGFQFEPNSATNEWARCYNQVYRANLVLHQLSEIERTSANSGQWDNIKGQALMIRGKAFLQAAIIWTLAYDETTADVDLGLPLRLDPDFNLPSVRSNLRQTYDQIVSDFTKSISLLPGTALAISRPAKPAVYAFLARTYLAMRKYDSALKYADSSLQLKNTLKDYNDPNVGKIATSSSASFSAIGPVTANPNPEILFAARAQIPPIAAVTRARIDTNLYDSYHANDLRKTVYFYYTAAAPRFYRYKGSYEGNVTTGFTGIAVDEVYLMRAECYARLGDKINALLDLNTLMKKRWKNTVPYPDILAADASEALSKILIERRKELVFRTIRWMDIKRFNKEGANMSLKRDLAQTYLLPPNDPRFALAIPEDVILISGMPQNPR